MSEPELAAFCNGKDALNVQKAMMKRWKKESISVKIAYKKF
jgi:hypothetical protein